MTISALVVVVLVFIPRSTAGRRYEITVLASLKLAFKLHSKLYDRILRLTVGKDLGLKCKQQATEEKRELEHIKPIVIGCRSVMVLDIGEQWVI